MTTTFGPIEDQSAILTVLSDPPGREVRLHCRILRGEGRTMLLGADRPLDSGAALRIEAGEFLWLGEVAGCRTEAGYFLIDVQLQHVLSNLSELMRMAERFRGHVTPAPFGPTTETS